MAFLRKSKELEVKQVPEPQPVQEHVPGQPVPLGPPMEIMPSQTSAGLGEQRGPPELLFTELRLSNEDLHTIKLQIASIEFALKELKCNLGIVEG